MSGAGTHSAVAPTVTQFWSSSGPDRPARFGLDGDLFGLIQLENHLQLSDLRPALGQNREVGPILDRTVLTSWDSL